MVIGLAITSVVLPLSVIGLWRLYRDVVERTPPEVDSSNMIEAIGTMPVQLNLNISDSLSGIAKVSIGLEQGDRTWPLEESDLRNEAEKKRFISYDLDINPQSLGLTEGYAYLVIHASDRAISHTNIMNKRYRLIVDYTKPYLYTHVLEKEIYPGNASIVLFSVKDTNLISTRVRVGTTFYSSYEARFLGRNFLDLPTWRFALIAPQVGAEFTEKFTLVATDIAGNSSEVTMPITVTKDKSKRATALTWRGVGEQLLESANKFSDESRLGSFLAGDNAVKNTKLAEMMTAAKAHKEEMLSQIALNNTQTPSGSSVFSAPFVLKIAGKPVYGYADTATYLFEDSSITTIKEREVLIQLQNRVPVVAAQAGKIILAQNMTPFGQFVAIDHGYGLVSVYGHLSEIKVSRDDYVDQGMTIGASGTSGIVPYESMSFQLFLCGQPIDPSSWQKEGWMKSLMDEAKVATLIRQ